MAVLFLEIIFTFHISMEPSCRGAGCKMMYMGNADLQAKGYDPSTLEPRNALGSPIMLCIHEE
ncbi:hypothetical protein NC651_031946 [Populus alba x Populus x berolinensis]|nr:hypothetical protein NC651_031946 [Populus alba x Populus x berolinensis]